MGDPEREKPQTVEILRRAAGAAEDYLSTLDGEPAAAPGREQAAEAFAVDRLPEAGAGGAAAIDELVSSGIPAATRSAGPRFLHFVTGGVTPAALAADWLASTLDQNSFSWISSPLGSRAEAVALAWLRDLFALPPAWGAVLTTGATMANFSALAAARRWWAAEHGRDVDADGFSGLPEVPVLSSGYTHASVLKALSMLGIGRSSVTRLTRARSGGSTAPR